jgi:transketolase
MVPRITIEPVIEHEYRVRIDDEHGDTVESEIIVAPDVLTDLGFTPADERRVVQHTAAFLVERQPVIDFPALVYLDEVVAAYDDYPEQLHHRLT